MSLRKLRFAIFGNIYQADRSNGIQHLLHLLEQRRAEVSMERAFFDYLSKTRGVALDGVTPFNEDDFEADFVVSMGGDGTLLRSAYCVGDRCIPIIGVNMGRLGFLAGVGVDDIEEVLDSLYYGEYTVDCLAMVQVETTLGNGEDVSDRALNEVAVLKRDNASMITIRTSINGEYIVTYHADGLIISTPTGSTAYSLSNGGPIMVPHTGVLCLTPVAPHSLTARPLVVPDSAVITLEVESRTHNFLVAADGRSSKYDESQILTISRSPFDAHIVKPKSKTYFSTLRQKMMWGADTRVGEKNNRQ
ncbi:MAG TPA: NAD kinase [Prevotella sp.]|nr:NAD kinase [Prevotella sp.]